MRIFGLDISVFKKPEIPVILPVQVEDQVPEVKVVIPDTTRPALIPHVRSPVLRYHAQKSLGRGFFREGEYNLAEIGRIEDTDSYVRQAFDKKVALMFKEGWDLVGKNPRTIKYIKTRLAQISKATGSPTQALFRDIGSSLVRKSNSFIIKVRKTEASGGRVRTEPNKTVPIKPIAGYFIAPAETIQYQLSGNKIVKWRQSMPNGDLKEYSPQDVLHIYYDRKEGFAFGTPQLVPVVDDIRALRKIEENIELLVYQHLFPLFQYIVGTEKSPAGVTEDGIREIDIIKTEIMFMPSEGGIVTPERHEIKAIGSEGRALRAEGYLEHFKKRVFSGLGLSAVDFGEGECHDSLTETLTENGWKFHDKINHLSERIATLNPNTGNIEFHFANHKYEGYYTGNMIRFKGKHLDAKVTPHHEMYIASRPKDLSKGLKFNKIYAKDLLDIGPSEFYMLETGIFADVKDPKTEMTFLANPKKIGRAKDITCKTSDFASLLGYYLSEGCIDTYNAKQGAYRTIISQNTGSSLDRIIGLIDRMGLSYSVIKRNNRQKESGVRIYGKALCNFFQDNVSGKSNSKSIPECVWHWDYQSRMNLFNALIDGHGSIDKRSGRTSKTYYTTSVKLADDVQILAMSVGYMAKVIKTNQHKDSYGSYIYRVLISGNGKDGKRWRLVSKKMISISKYDGEVYCYNVPNHLLVTRRNGKTLISGNTANRATADNMSRNLIDLVKDFQQVFEMFINDFILNELLLESTFGDAVLDEENVVTVVFKEIDVDAQIKKEAHSADLFAKDIIEHDEARQRLGLEPWIIPTPDEVQSETDRPEMFPQWHKSRWKMFDLPKLLIQALDEPWSPQARAAAADSSLPMTEEGNKQSAREQNEQEITLEKERTKAKVAVAKAKPAPKKRDGLLVQAFIATKKDVVNRVKAKNRLEHDWVSQLVRISLGTIIDQLISQQILSFRAGYAQHRTVEDPVFVGSLSLVRVRFRDRAEHYVNKLANSLVSSLKRNINNLEPDHIVAETRAVFDALEFRTHFIEDVEIRKAFTFGQLSALRDTGVTTVLVAAKPGTSSIIAQSKDGEPIQLGLMTLDDIPPFHANDTTKFVIAPITDSVLQDEGADDVGEAVPSSEFRSCPECGKTAIRTKGTADIYNCKACGHAFQALQSDTEAGDKEVEDATLEQCVLSTKKSLRKQHPDWTADRVKSAAFAICNSQRKGK